MIFFDIEAERAILQYEAAQKRLGYVGLMVFMEHKVAPFIEDRTKARFRSEGDDASGKWAQLAMNTGLIRASQGYAPFHPINVRTGELMRTVLTHRTRRVGTGASITFPGKVNRRQKEKLQVAQMGGGTKRGGRSRIGPNRPAPPRPVLALGQYDQLWIRERLADYAIHGGSRVI